VRAELGVGEAARLVVATLNAAGIPYAVLPFDETSNRKRSGFSDYGTGEAEYDVNLICVNADQLPVFVRFAGTAFLRDRYTIGSWYWEVEDCPPEMAASAELVDEIWVASRHAAEAIGRSVEAPVFCCPPPILAPSAPKLTRGDLGLPEGFLFVFTFDFNSVLERKNPLAAIEAFSRAFDPGEGPTLLVKTINGDLHPDRRDLLVGAARSRPDVMVVDRYFSVQEQRALSNLCDAVVSLHRSEGFGLTIAEAMAFGKPAIATAYSGNLEFMDERNSYLVPYELAEIPPGCEPYPAGSRWAEPDVAVAAELMRRVVDVPDEAAAKGRQAAEDVRELHSPERRAALMTTRLEAIEERRPFGTAAARASATIAPPRTPARAYLDVRPVVSRRPPIRIVQQFLLRLIRSYTRHQRTMDEALVGDIDVLRDELKRLEASQRALLRRIATLEGRATHGDEK
jgi:glycosyltransferase involved in cell wall biosynthesis